MERDEDTLVALESASVSLDGQRVEEDTQEAGQQDGSMGKRGCYQAGQPELMMHAWQKERTDFHKLPSNLHTNIALPKSPLPQISVTQQKTMCSAPEEYQLTFSLNIHSYIHALSLSPNVQMTLIDIAQPYQRQVGERLTQRVMVLPGRATELGLTLGLLIPEPTFSPPSETTESIHIFKLFCPGAWPYLVCSCMAGTCQVSSGDPCLLQGLFYGEAAVYDEGHHFFQLF